MSPDDPRHGKRAGYLAHRRAGQDPCTPCREAHTRACKSIRYRLDHGVRVRVPLGEDGWAIVDQATRTQLHKATGLSLCLLTKLHTRGPTGMVLSSTRQTILDARVPFTTQGVVRRMQALGALGWSSRVIGQKTGVAEANVVRLRQGSRQYVRHDIAVRLVALYEELHMTRAPKSRSASNTLLAATRLGWVPPLAWDDIDTDPAPAETTSDTQLDGVAIDRVLAGDRRVVLSPAEKRAATARWQESGQSLAALERITGWRVDRYVTREEVTAA